jgi:hypothetical protein
VQNPNQAGPSSRNLFEWYLPRTFHIVVDSIERIELSDITEDLARESGFPSVEELLQVARHGRGDNVYLIRFHYLPPGGWERGRVRQ